MGMMGRSGVRLTIRDTGEIKSVGKFLLDVSVGIQPEDAGQKHHSGLTIGALAEIHEFGSAAAHIPMRSWFRTWADKNQDAARAAIRAALVEMARTQRYSVEPIQRIVHRMKATLVGRIAAGAITPPNAPRTLAKKSPETRPLVETKAFMRAIQGAFQASTVGGTRGAPRFSWKYKTPGGEGA